MASLDHTVEEHFDKCSPEVEETYKKILDAARDFGPVFEEAKKTSIHLVRKTAFAGVATRKSALILTLKSATDIRNSRVFKREQTSANRWHVEIRLTTPHEVDQELKFWIKSAYELAG